MRLLALILFCLLPVSAAAQSRTVLPEELTLWIEVEEAAHTPMEREMVLVTIRGIYRRHITREAIIQPDLEGFSWSQLGNDTWRDERLEGQKVKTFSRRMALYPDRAGELTIGAFTHRLTLTDAQDKWFEHQVKSEPVTISVKPAPPGRDWWFPVRSLKVSDQWSNAPDQLQPGEGVLRVVRIEALGVTPEMIPPMPELTSPSAMIFPHPEKRFVELSAAGPTSYAFWRWTIRPGNDVSAIVEPLSFDYFDTALREDLRVTISAQRVAYGDLVPQATPIASAAPNPRQLPGWPMAGIAILVFLAGVGWAIAGRHLDIERALEKLPLLDPLLWQLRRAARAGNRSDVRRMLLLLAARGNATPAQQGLLAEFDAAIYGAKAQAFDLTDLARRARSAAARPWRKPV